MTQAEINRALSQELERVLHDLSNTLTGLLMNAGLLSVSLRNNERLSRLAVGIHESATRSAELLREARRMTNSREIASKVDSKLTVACDAGHSSEREEPPFRRGDRSTRKH